MIDKIDQFLTKHDNNYDLKDIKTLIISLETQTWDYIDNNEDVLKQIEQLKILIEVLKINKLVADIGNTDCIITISLKDSTSQYVCNFENTSQLKIFMTGLLYLNFNNNKEVQGIYIITPDAKSNITPDAKSNTIDITDINFFSYGNNNDAIELDLKLNNKESSSNESTRLLSSNLCTLIKSINDSDDHNDQLSEYFMKYLEIVQFKGILGVDTLNVSANIEDYYD